MLKPTLVSIVTLDGRNESALLALAASAARDLDTPLRTAILESARERDVEVAAVDRAQQTEGAGVVASIDGRTVVIGDATLFANLGLSVDRLGGWPERLQQRGQQVLFVAIDGHTAGFLGVIDVGMKSGRRDGSGAEVSADAGEKPPGQL
jgi:Cu+-exporting ATPase